MPCTGARLRASSTSCTAPCTVTFTMTASGGSGQYIYSLDWGDGTAGWGSGVTTATSETASHTYQNAGTYTATLYVQDYVTLNQCKATATVSVATPPSQITVTFQESGLPSYSIVDGQPDGSVGWSVTVNGQLYSAAAGQSISVTGTPPLNWTASNVYVQMNTARVTYYPKPSSGSVSSSTTITIQYSTTAALRMRRPFQ